MSGYIYRQLSKEEREQILEHRHANSYPWHAPPHPYRSAGYYLLTAANFEHQMIMDSPERRTEFELSLLDAMRSINAEAMAWVILPNHYHILVGVEALEEISTSIGLLHGRTSRRWNVADGVTGKRRVWYKFADQLMRDQRHFYRTLNYIHYNPAKHGYVSDPYEWPWTSLHIYLSDYGRDWLRDQWRAYPPGDIGDKLE